MKFVKSQDGEQIDAVNADGQIVGYIRKDRMGTHGHWHGWKHYIQCERKCNEFVWCGVWASAIYPERAHTCGLWERWTDEPSWFANIKEFKEYYGGVQ